MHSGRQFGGYFPVFSHLVRNVCQIGRSRRYPANDRQRFVQREVREVFFFAEGVDDQGVRAFQFFQFRIVYPVHIGYVTEFADAETQYRKPVVHAPDRDDAAAVDFERLFCNRMQHDFWNAGIFVFCESVVEIFSDDVQDPFFRINVDGAFQYVVESPYVVQSARMVFMPVGKQNGVDPVGMRTQHLVTKVGAGIDYQLYLFRFYQYGTAQSFVFRVVRTAYRALASDNWNTLRSPGP